MKGEKTAHGQFTELIIEVRVRNKPNNDEYLESKKLPSGTCSPRANVSSEQFASRFPENCDTSCTEDPPENE